MVSEPADGHGRERISAVLAVRNEAAQIAEAVEQLRFFADEVIVVDMESQDGTPDIARSMGCRVIPHDGGPHRLIHVNKNAGFDAAAGPWILNLDADERLTAELRDEILGILRAPDPGIAAYALPFTHYFFGKYLRHGGFRGSLVRFFRKGKLRYPEDRAHSAPVVDGAVRELRNLVVHFNHRRIADFVSKMNLYTSQDAPLIVKNGRGGLRDRPIPARLGASLFTAPLGVFWNRYVKHAGFRDGAHGFVAAVLLAAYQLVEHAKVWEALHVHEEGPA